jgi:hypothetical protein
MERKTWEKVSRAMEMKNAMTYVLNRYLIMGDFTVKKYLPSRWLVMDVCVDFSFRFRWTKCEQIILHELRIVL